jgi:hypothetical protein
MSDRSVWREVKFVSLWLKTGFCGEVELFLQLERTFENLKVEKRKKRRQLQLHLI